MKQEMVFVEERKSTRVELGQLIISGRETYSDRVHLVVGRPGLPNVAEVLSVGDAVLFETPDHGLLEVRAFSTSVNGAEVLVTCVSPRPGISGGLVDADPNNQPFTGEERTRIQKSLDEVRRDVARHPDIAPEQLDLILRKLSEIQEAAERLGRKDWIHFTAGLLGNLVVSAAFQPGVAKAIFDAANTAFQWVFTGALRLLA